MNPYLVSTEIVPRALKFYEQVSAERLSLSKPGVTRRWPHKCPQNLRLIMHSTLSVGEAQLRGADSPPDGTSNQRESTSPCISRKRRKVSKSSKLSRKREKLRCRFSRRFGPPDLACASIVSGFPGSSTANRLAPKPERNFGVR